MASAAATSSSESRVGATNLLSPTSGDTASASAGAGSSVGSPVKAASEAQTVADLDELLGIWAKTRIKEAGGAGLAWLAADSAGLYKTGGGLQDYLHKGSSILKSAPRFISFTPVGSLEEASSIDEHSKTKIESDNTIVVVNDGLEPKTARREASFNIGVTRESTVTSDIKTSLSLEAGGEVPVVGVSLKLALSREYQNSKESKNSITETREVRCPVTEVTAPPGARAEARAVASKRKTTTIRKQKVRMEGNVILCCSDEIHLAGHSVEGNHRKWKVSIGEIFGDLHRYQNESGTDLISKDDRSAIESHLKAFEIGSGAEGIRFSVQETISDVSVTFDRIEYSRPISLATGLPLPLPAVSESTPSAAAPAIADPFSSVLAAALAAPHPGTYNGVAYAPREGTTARVAGHKFIGVRYTNGAMPASGSAAPALPARPAGLLQLGNLFAVAGDGDAVAEGETFLGAEVVGPQAPVVATVMAPSAATPLAAAVAGADTGASTGAPVVK